MALPSLYPLFDHTLYDAAAAAVQLVTINAIGIQTRPRLYWMLVILGAQLAVVDQKWTKQGRETKILYEKTQDLDHFCYSQQFLSKIIIF